MEDPAADFVKSQSQTKKIQHLNTITRVNVLGDLQSRCSFNGYSEATGCNYDMFVAHTSFKQSSDLVSTPTARSAREEYKKQLIKSSS